MGTRASEMAIALWKLQVVGCNFGRTIDLQNRFSLAWNVYMVVRPAMMASIGALP